MWEAIFITRAAYHTANPEVPKTIQTSQWLFPDAGELGGFNTGPAYMPRKTRERLGWFGECNYGVE